MDSQGADASLNRRRFLALSTLGAVSATRPVFSAPVQGSGQVLSGDHFVSPDKRLTPAAIEALFAKGERKVYRGAERKTLGMPCGGIGAGQLYVKGDGTLGYWWIMNNGHHSSFGGQTKIATEWGEYGVCYGTYAPPSPVEHGFTLTVDEKPVPLSDEGFDDIGFIGEYPVATVLYERKSKPKLPVTVKSEVFSPFIPLNAPDSGLPATILRYTVKNTSQKPVSVAIQGYMISPILQMHRDTINAEGRLDVLTTKGVNGVIFSAVEGAVFEEKAPLVMGFDDFESGYGKWKLEGDCFGEKPAPGTLPGQQNVSGHTGNHLVNTFLKGDGATGKATSEAFKIELPYVWFKIGGGSDSEKLGFRLIVDGKIARRAVGKDNERLETAYWDVKEFVGKTAHFEIVDEATGGWGHINVDDISFADAPPLKREKFSKDHPNVGEIALVGLGENISAFFGQHRVAPLSRPMSGGAACWKDVALAPGKSKTFTFVLAWHFPNRKQNESEANPPGGRIGADGPIVGNFYATRFKDVREVVDYVAKNEKRLVGETFAFRDALYDTTMPYWLTQRISMPLANLATEVVQRWKSGRVWCWEGVGCCTGCCGHVWNYAQGMARLFPELERSVRTMQDFDPNHGFDEKTGAIGFRGVGHFWAGDSQGGYVLKAYREHLCSTDSRFLKSVWPQVKKALEFLIERDENGDGLIESSQHNTYDINFEGANTMVGSLYLAALKAGAKMARLQNDPDSSRYETLARRGSEQTMKRLFNGEYFIQEVDLKKHPKHQYADGCLSDQLLGQWFSHQLDLGYLYPEASVKSAISSVFRYNWAPDIGPQTKAHHPDRDFIHTGEAGLLTCTWPKSKHLGPESVLYRDEVWTGIEHQVAAHLLYEGKAVEALAIERGIHERYDGAKHNPWNEIECGDHYARALASWSLLLAASGFVYDGPAGKLGFAPNLTPDDFRSFFSAAEGWGTLAQKRGEGVQTQTISVKWGRVKLHELTFEHPTATKAEVALAGKKLVARISRNGERIVVALPENTVVRAGQTLEIRLS